MHGLPYARNVLGWAAADRLRPTRCSQSADGAVLVACTRGSQMHGDPHRLQTPLLAPSGWIVVKLDQIPGYCRWAFGCAYGLVVGLGVFHSAQGH
jgi:hypothetical protein